MVFQMWNQQLQLHTAPKQGMEVYSRHLLLQESITQRRGMCVESIAHRRGMCVESIPKTPSRNYGYLNPWGVYTPSEAHSY